MLQYCLTSLWLQWRLWRPPQLSHCSLPVLPHLPSVPWLFPKQRFSPWADEHVCLFLVSSFCSSSSWSLAASCFSIFPPWSGARPAEPWAGLRGQQCQVGLARLVCLQGPRWEGVRLLRPASAAVRHLVDGGPRRVSSGWHLHRLLFYMASVPCLLGYVDLRPFPISWVLAYRWQRSASPPVAPTPFSPGCAARRLPPSKPPTCLPPCPAGSRFPTGRMRRRLESAWWWCRRFSSSVL